MTTLFGKSDSGGSTGTATGNISSFMGGLGSRLPGAANNGAAKSTSTADIIASAPKPSASVPVPDVTPAAPIPAVTPAAEIPTATSAATIAAGNAAARTIAQRAGRQSTVLTKRQPRAAPQPIAATAGSDYSAKTLG